MYWTILGRSERIEKSSMNGENRTVLHDTGLYIPSAIAVDHERQLLYWVDSLYYYDDLILESSGVDGSNRRTLLRYYYHFHVGFGLAVMDNRLYYIVNIYGQVVTVFEADSVNETNVYNHTLYLSSVPSCTYSFNIAVVSAQKQFQGKEAITIM